MSTSTNPTFRDFASQIFASDLPGASQTLVTLLGLSPEASRVAAEYFQRQTSDPTFLPKAMSLRTAVEGADDSVLVTLLGDCFGLDSATAQAATTALRSRYSPPA
jgi:hypothetical protein